MSRRIGFSISKSWKNQRFVSLCAGATRRGTGSKSVSIPSPPGWREHPKILKQIHMMDMYPSWKNPYPGFHKDSSLPI